MKVLIALLACVAVSQAAFTANLRQRSQSALSQAAFKVRLASRGDEFQTGLIENLNQQANDLMAQLEVALATGSTMADNLLAQLSTTWGQISDLGGQVVQGAGNAWDHATNALSEMWNNIWGIFGSRQGRLDFSDVLDFVQTLPAVQNIGQYVSQIQEFLSNAHATLTNLEWDQVLSAAVQHLIGSLSGKRALGDFVSNLVSNGQAALGNLFEQHVKPVIDQIQAQASAAYEQAQIHIQNTLAQAAQVASQIQTQLAAGAAQLGPLYQQVVDLVNSLTQA